MSNSEIVGDIAGRAWMDTLHGDYIYGVGFGWMMDDESGWMADATIRPQREIRPEHGVFKLS